MSMDAAPRNVFLSGIIPPHGRTRVLGILNITKTLASAAGPTVSGFLAGKGQLWRSFVACGMLKLCYDVGLFTMFGTAKMEH